jgi:hypothetical protein
VKQPHGAIGEALESFFELRVAFVEASRHPHQPFGGSSQLIHAFLVILVQRGQQCNGLRECFEPFIDIHDYQSYPHPLRTVNLILAYPLGTW